MLIFDEWWFDHGNSPPLNCKAFWVFANTADRFAKRALGLAKPSFWAANILRLKVGVMEYNGFDCVWTMTGPEGVCKIEGAFNIFCIIGKPTAGVVLVEQTDSEGLSFGSVWLVSLVFGVSSSGISCSPPFPLTGTTGIVPISVLIPTRLLLATVLRFCKETSPENIWVKRLYGISTGIDAELNCGRNFSCALLNSKCVFASSDCWCSDADDPVSSVKSISSNDCSVSVPSSLESWKDSEPSETGMALTLRGRFFRTSDEITGIPWWRWLAFNVG